MSTATGSPNRIDPATLEVTVRLPDGRKLPARIHWSEPLKLVSTTVRNQVGAEIATVILPEGDGFDTNDTLAIETGVSAMYSGDDFDDVLSGESRELGIVRLSGTITIDVEDHVLKADEAAAVA